MPKIVSAAEFQNAMPRYVSQAHLLVDAVIEKGLSMPDDDIQVRAVRNTRIGSESSDPVELQELWKQRDGEDTRLRFDADVGLERLRLAVERTRWKRSAWLYIPPIPAQDMEAMLNNEAETPPGDQLVLLDWVSSPERHRPQNLASPAWSFRKTPERHELDRIEVGLYADVTHYSSVAFWQRDITEITADSYRQARHPKLQPTDRAHLENGVYTLHTVKIEGLLNILGLVAH